MVRKVNSNTYDNWDVHAIGGNSVAFTTDKFVATNGGFLILATASTNVVGRCKMNITTAADNQTVDKVRVIYEEQKPQTTWEVAITGGGSLTQADEGKYFKLSDASTMDGSTAHASPSGLQFQLVRFISTTKGLFKII